MKKLTNFVTDYELNNPYLVEGRKPGSKNKPKDINMDKIEGKDAEKNGTDGAIGFNEPKDNEAQDVDIDKSQLDKNTKRLLMKFKAEDDFFIIGRAGWGKTSIIKSLADKYHYDVITFYLDKCEAADLGGIPVAGKDEHGRPKQIILPPPFADKIAQNPKQKYLLFFDEMNQASPDVMNALMPIVLEHEIAGEKYDNFFCGAAGNFESENGAVSELSGPLKSRFKPLIVWETGDEEAWAGVFKYLHKQWDDKLTKKLVDAFEENAELFDNPREIEQKIFERYIWKMIQKKDNFDIDEWQDHLLRMAKDELTRNQEENVIPQLAELIYDTVKGGGKSESKESSGRSRGRDTDINMIPNNVKNAIRQGMKYGYIEQIEDGKKVKYGISRENIGSIEETILNAEMLERIISKFEADGIEFKFEKDSEWKAKGYKDPNED